MLRCNWCVDNLTAWLWSHAFELILTCNWKTVMAKFVTHAILNYLDFCVNAFHVHTETYRVSPDPSFPVRDIESDPCWPGLVGSGL